MKSSKKQINITEILYNLPSNWEWVTISQLASKITDGTHKTPLYTKSGVKFVSIENISKGYLNLSKTKYISEDEHFELSKRCNPEKGDILICRIGTLGKPVIIETDEQFSIFVSLGLLKIIDKNLTHYILNVLKSPLIDKFIENIKVGGGTHTFKINIEDLYMFPIPLPPLKEQQKILDTLSILKRIN